MNTGEICDSRVPGLPSSSFETQEKRPPNSWIELKGILTQNEKSPIIHKVPTRLRQANEKPYEPSVISIGPYHHGKSHLKEMEDIKKRFFIKTVGESNENLESGDVEATSGEKIKINAIEDLETPIRADLEKIKECYAEPLDVKFDSEEEFVDMVLFDGFFIVQFIMGNYPEEVYKRQSIFDEIFSDLLLLENQLPFFVLVKLLQIMTKNKVTEEAFIYLTLELFGAVRNSEFPILEGDIKHLLHLIHDSKWLPSNKEDKELKKAIWGWKFIRRASNMEETIRKRQGVFIRCATELENAGISFESRDEEEEECRVLDIEFKRHCGKSKLRIPTLIVDHHTERILGNLIAFEQSFGPYKPTYVFDYVKFLDLLINSGEDVRLFCYSGIIENYLGEYEDIARVFNRLCDNAYGSTRFYYSDVFGDVNDHCHNNWRQQMAYLQRTYFNSAWALLSFLAALLLILLTMAQTIFTLLSTDCVSCSVVFIVFVVSLLVIGLLFCFFFSFR